MVYCGEGATSNMELRSMTTKKTKPHLTFHHIVVTAVLAIYATLGMTTDAAARINCDGQYQVIKGQGLLPTPYCEASYLAKVAGTFGVRTTAKLMRNSVNAKQRICRVVGHDHRVRDICSGFGQEDRGRKWP